MFLKKATIDQGRFPTRDAYPFNLKILQQSDSIGFPSPVTIFSGENGTGKSTLLSAICRRCNIYIWEGMYRPRYNSNPHEKMLYQALDIEWDNGAVPGSFFSPDLFRNFSQLVDEWSSASPGLIDYFGGRSFMAQSHGQSFLSYFRSRFKVKGIHFLDEPEAALSPTSQMEFVKLLTEASDAGLAQFIISTHSPIIMACSQATIYNFDNDFISRISYRDTHHYRVYKEFFENE